MKLIRKIGPGLTALALVAGVCFAQAPQGPAKPGPEHQRLARFVGKWTGKGTMKDGPMGPGGPMSWTESCEWFAGGFSLVCKSEGKGPMGEMKGLGIMGYDTEEKAYTYYGVDNSGMADLSKGSVNGKVWTYISTSRMGGKTMQGRFSLTEVSDTKQTFKWEVSEDGRTWTVLMEGESSK